MTDAEVDAIVAQAVGTEFAASATRQPVLVRDVRFTGRCPCHGHPFPGRAHVAYLPEGRSVRASALVRAVDAVARCGGRQTWFTERLAHGLMHALRPRGVGVWVEALHPCGEAGTVRTRALLGDMVSPVWYGWIDRWTA